MSQYPAKSTSANLYTVANALTAALSGTVDGDVVTIPVVDNSTWPSNGGAMVIDSEVITYSGILNSEFTGCIRAADGTSNVTHTDATSVVLGNVALNQNRIKDEVIAIGDDLVDSLAALDDAGTPADTASDIKERFDQVVTQINDLGGMTNWYDSASTPILKDGSRNFTGDQNFEQDITVDGSGNITGDIRTDGDIHATNIYGAIVHDSTIDHGSLAGLADDDHSQYLNETRHDALAADNPHTVTFTQAVTADGSTDISAAEAETLTDESMADALHGHATASGHIDDATIHFTEASVDHGSIAGLGDDDHTQYALADGSKNITGDQTFDQDIFVTGSGNITGDVRTDGSFRGDTVGLTVGGLSIDRTVVSMKVYDDTTVATSGAIGAIHYHIPYELNGYNLIQAEAAVTSGSPATVLEMAVYNATDSVEMLSTNVTIDANETTSYTATTRSVVDPSNDDVVTGDDIRIDVDSAASTNHVGLEAILSFRLP